MKLELSSDAIAQWGHVGWGALLSLAPAVIFHTNVLYFAIPVIVAAAIKEYADAHGLESTALAGNSWEDFSFWCIGVLLGIFAVIASNLIGGVHHFPPAPPFHFVPSHFISRA